MLMHYFNTHLRIKKCLFLIPLILLCVWSAIGQSDEDLIQSATSDSIIYRSPARITLLANAAVRFQNNAIVYLKWEGVPNVAQYEVKYQTGATKSWSTVVASANEITLEDLPLDQEFIWEVSIPNTTVEYVSDKGVFSTKPQIEPIVVSKPFYKKLAAWFSTPKGQVDFFDFLSATNLAIPEQASFLQAYLYDNQSFRAPGNPLDLGSWLPPAPPSGGGTDTLTPGECRCKVISDGSNIATPNESIDEVTGVVIPRKSQFIGYAPGDRTYVDRFEAGAAKFVSLRQNENTGGMNYQMSNLEQGAEDTTAVTTEASAIQFFLACLRTGGTSTNLPERCQCERPLTVKFQYSSRLHIKAEKKGCGFSSSTAAQAEDMAFVAAFNQGTGQLTALDAGQFMAGRGCSSNWNPDFWIQLLNVIAPVGEFYLQSLDTLQPGSNIPTTNQLTQLIQEVQTLIGTPFSNKQGECGSLQDDRVLVDGSHIFMLRPNEPIIVTLFSSYYVRTRGYGCYRSEAGVASDYFLAGVVESQLTEDPECCTDKFSTYIVGALSNPPEGDVHINSPNTIENNLQKVGFFLSSFGSWYGLQAGSSSGQILLKKQFDRISGPSCELKKGERSNQEHLLILASGIENVVLYPTLSDDQVNIRINTPESRFLRIRFLNLQGQIVRDARLGLIDSGETNLGFDVSSYTAGTYFAQIVLGTKTYMHKFIVR